VVTRGTPVADGRLASAPAWNKACLGREEADTSTTRRLLLLLLRAEARRCSNRTAAADAVERWRLVVARSAGLAGVRKGTRTWLRRDVLLQR